MAGMREHGWIMGHGYEGRSIAEYIADLSSWGADVLVDVRLNPISRKRGFSKTALREALAEAGVRYEHRPALGNPKDNRDGFWKPGTPQHRTAVSRFRDVLAVDQAAEDLAELAELANDQRVVLLCFEAEERCCHRKVVLEQVRQLVAERSLVGV